MSDHIKELTDAETILNAAMHNVVGDYATRVVFAWDRVSITDGGDRMIPTDEMAARMSKVLGRAVSREEFLERCKTPPNETTVLGALARVFEVEVGWLLAGEAAEES